MPPIGLPRSCGVVELDAGVLGPALGGAGVGDRLVGPKPTASRRLQSTPWAIEPATDGEGAALRQGLVVGVALDAHLS
jgi:hypothetical protein